MFQKRARNRTTRRTIVRYLRVQWITCLISLRKVRPSKLVGLTMYLIKIGQAVILSENLSKGTLLQETQVKGQIREGIQILVR